jgi:hypothetical protein
MEMAWYASFDRIPISKAFQKIPGPSESQRVHVLHRFVLRLESSPTLMPLDRKWYLKVESYVAKVSSKTCYWYLLFLLTTISPNCHSNTRHRSAFCAFFGAFAVFLVVCIVYSYERLMFMSLLSSQLCTTKFMRRNIINGFKVNNRYDAMMTSLLYHYDVVLSTVHKYPTTARRVIRSSALACIFFKTFQRFFTWLNCPP